LNEVGIGALGSLLPEIILLVGGLLILILDTALTKEEDSGSGFMAIAVIFLAVALIGSVLQLNMDPHTAVYMIEVDPFSSFFKISILIGMLLVAIAGGGYMNRHATGRGEFWTLFMFVTLAMSLAVAANNLLMIFLAIEILSITSYILVGFLRDNSRSAEAGVKYFLYGSVASAIMLYGMSLLYGASGSLNIFEIGRAFAQPGEAAGQLAIPAITLLLVGLGFKASLAPFFQWAPDTYDGAPIPITAYLSTASKAVGFAVMARILLIALGSFDFNWVPLLGGLSILTMSVGNLMALRQESVKRMLAYSSVAQAGYILMGLVAVVSGSQTDVNGLSNNGLNAVLIYLFAYLFTNIGAFLVVMAVEERMGSSKLSSFNGLAQKSPALAWSMFIFMLSLTGIPATGGFMGKFYVFGATIQHQYFWLAAAGMINAGIAAFYYLNVVRAMFFTASDQADEETAPAGQTAFAIAIPIQIIVMVCVVATIWIGLYPPPVIELANDASRYLLTLVF
jgi:proton-translocating NADH-quinone oxidoreductase chain N